jgi:hypothetical protein
MTPSTLRAPQTAGPAGRPPPAGSAPRDSPAGRPPPPPAGSTPRDSPADRVALLRRHWREGDMSHNLAVAAMAGLPFEQARQLALLPPREPRPL